MFLQVRLERNLLFFSKYPRWRSTSLFLGHPDVNVQRSSSKSTRTAVRFGVHFVDREGKLLALSDGFVSDISVGRP